VSSTGSGVAGLALLRTVCDELSQRTRTAPREVTDCITSLEGLTPLGPKNVKHRAGGSTVMDHWFQDGMAWRRYVCF